MNSASDSHDFVEQSNAQKVFNINQRSAAYSVGPIQGHVHNGVDSNKIDYGDLLNAPRPSYLGYVNVDGTAGTPFPKNWTSSTTGTGLYTVTFATGLTLSNYVYMAFAFAGKYVSSNSTSDRGSTSINFEVLATIAGVVTPSNGPFMFIIFT